MAMVRRSKTNGKYFMDIQSPEEVDRCKEYLLALTKDRDELLSRKRAVMEQKRNLLRELSRINGKLEELDSKIRQNIVKGGL